MMERPPRSLVEVNMQKISEIPGKPEVGTFEAARLIGVSVPTIRRLVEHGHLPGWRIGRNYKTSKEAIDDFLSRNARPLAA